VWESKPTLLKVIEGEGKNCIVDEVWVPGPGGYEGGGDFDQRDEIRRIAPCVIKGKETEKEKESILQKLSLFCQGLGGRAGLFTRPN